MTASSLPPAPRLPETLGWFIQLPERSFFVSTEQEAKLWAGGDVHPARVTPVCALNTLWVTSLLVDLLKQARTGLDENSEDTLANSLALTVSKIDVLIGAIEKTALPDLTDPRVLHVNLLRGLPATLTRAQRLHLAGCEDYDRMVALASQHEDFQGP